MKGVLIGVDFITQADGTVQLLEVNTGVQFTQDIAYFDYQKLVDFAVENNLATISVVDKPTVNAADKYNNLSTACTAAGIGYEFIEVAATDIYPPSVEGEETKLVVRVTYDESAIVDSTYAKDNYSFMNLFNKYDSGSAIVNSYFSSSIDGNYDNLNTNSNTINGSVIPNIIIKKRFPDLLKNDYPHFFAAVTQEDVDNIKTQYLDEEVIINNYVVDTNHVTGDKLGSQIRKWYFLYGATLSSLELGGYRYTNEAPLQLPLEFEAGTNKIENHEKKALTSNATPAFYYGVPSDSYVDKIVDGNTVNVLASEVNEGDTVKTVVIPGISLDNETEYITEGYGFPSDAYYSSSVVVIKTDTQVNDHLLKFGLSGEENADLTISAQERIYVFSESDNLTKFRAAKDIVVGDKIISNLSDSVTVTSKEYTYYSGTYITLDVEQVDAFVGGPTVNLNFFMHNPPFCFVAGTEITLANGDVKNIEDIAVGEEVLTYNEATGENESGVVGDLKQHTATSIIRLTLDNENIITTTSEHPFFVQGKWVKAGDLQPLDVCKKVDGSESIISTVEPLMVSLTVYNLLSVSNNQNFFANGILVHNKKME